MKVLTERQKEVYLFIVEYQKDHGYSPSIRDIGKGLYMSAPTVSRHINNLVRYGYISYTPRVARSIILNNSDRVS